MKYKVTAIAHNRNFFTNPDRVVFEIIGNFENEDGEANYDFIHECENKAKELLNMDYPMEMYFKEV